MELWDAYDSDYKKIDGMTLVRGEERSIPKGIYHLVVFILVQHSDGTYLLTKRDPRKACGGMLEASAGGSALKGETPEEAAARELREETGIKVGTSALIETERRISDDDRCLYFSFICSTDCDKDSIILLEGETCEYEWVTAEELLRRADEIISLSALRYIRRSKQ